MLVKLRNLNDNPIKFNLPSTIDRYGYTIEENVKTLPSDLTGKLIQIDDADLSDGSGDDEVALTLEGDELFDNFRIIKLARFVYKIEATRTFDYEFRSKYEFVVRANDGVHTTRIPVVVDIVDLNDNRPVFEASEYLFRIDENSPINSLIGQVKSIDLDGTFANNQTLYMFATHSDENLFNLDRASGELSVFDVSKLDRESQDTFNVTVIAYNPSAPIEMRDTAVVIIKLNDLNDNVPKFERSMYQVSSQKKKKEVLIRK
jgi:protocadherin Fat 4